MQATSPAKAKLFMHGRSQAVRLPKEFRFDGTEVYVRHQGDEVVLSARPRASMQGLVESLAGFEPGFRLERQQPAQPDERAHSRQRVGCADRMRYLLDTNICIYVINERPPAVLARFLQHESDGIGISVITASELYWGVRKSGSRRNAEALERFLAPLTVADYDLAAARAYGEVRAGLERKGTPIGPLDLQIAAHALALQVTLVTNNVREFKRVPGLTVENWVPSP